MAASLPSSTINCADVRAIKTALLGAAVQSATKGDHAVFALPTKACTPDGVTELVLAAARAASAHGRVHVVSPFSALVSSVKGLGGDVTASILHERTPSIELPAAIKLVLFVDCASITFRFPDKDSIRKSIRYPDVYARTLFDDEDGAVRLRAHRGEGDKKALAKRSTGVIFINAAVLNAASGPFSSAALDLARDVLASGIEAQPVLRHTLFSVSEGNVTTEVRGDNPSGSRSASRSGSRSRVPPPGARGVTLSRAAIALVRKTCVPEHPRVVFTFPAEDIGGTVHISRAPLGKTSGEDAADEASVAASATAVAGGAVAAGEDPFVAAALADVEKVVTAVGSTTMLFHVELEERLARHVDASRGAFTEEISIPAVFARSRAVCDTIVEIASSHGIGFVELFTNDDDADGSAGDSTDAGGGEAPLILVLSGTTEASVEEARSDVVELVRQEEEKRVRRIGLAVPRFIYSATSAEPPSAAGFSNAIARKSIQADRARRAANAALERAKVAAVTAAVPGPTAPGEHGSHGERGSRFNAGGGGFGGGR